MSRLALVSALRAPTKPAAQRASFPQLRIDDPVEALGCIPARFPLATRIDLNVLNCSLAWAAGRLAGGTARLQLLGDRGGLIRTWLSSDFAGIRGHATGTPLAGTAGDLLRRPS